MCRGRVSIPSTREVGKIVLLDVKAQSGQRSHLPIQATLCSRKDLLASFLCMDNNKKCFAVCACFVWLSVYFCFSEYCFMIVLGHNKNDQKVQIVHKYSLPAPHMITVSLGFFTAFFRTTCAFRLYALQQRNLKNQDEVSKFHLVGIHFKSPLKP